ncbi:GreA/GreB family elongation factor [Paenibacillus sp. MMS20-IR301]|uniref:GreA/GreB family elongation factor n=1 Tax=Paenibacillus sp. MMS20-IR301 TaxID=2895946 RepID=UPI0028F13CC9|nr:GreA/GreB family elongation factor [Paenibacillus sp. MMS20-IR301]WNS44238.1 GreA/GreB family elongation factor [Paenibacillus sp. MMS20-IR301]
MSRSTGTISLREELVQQLVYLDEHRFTILDRMAWESAAERSEIQDLIKRYQAAVEQILAGDNSGLERSMVLAGSFVSLQIGQETLKDAYRIVIPGEAELDEFCISIWSPMGRGLLLACPGDTVTIQTPFGSDEVLILDNVYAGIA